MPLQLLILSAPTNGTLILDATPFVQACSISRNEHGPQELQATLYRSLYDAFRIYDALGTLHVELNDGAQCLWAGRLEEPGLNVGGGDRLELHAYGYWRALSDIPYTTFWSITKVDDWKPVIATEFFNSYPDRFTFDTNNRISIAPQKNSAQGPSFAGRMAYSAPNQASKLIVGIQFDYEMIAPAGWEAGMERMSAAWGFGTTEWTLTATGVLQTGSVYIAFAVCDRFTLYMYLPTGAATYTGETGAAYIRITNVRLVGSTTNAISTTLTANRAAGTNVTATVGSTAGMYVGQRLVMNSGSASESVVVLSIGGSTTFNATFVKSYTSGQTVRAHRVLADDIIKDLVSVINATNSGQLSSSTINIASPALDITDAVYEDRVPQDIAIELATKGDGSSRVWEVGVDVLRRLFFRVRASKAQTWYVDIADLTLTRSLDGLYNSAYAKYEDANGRTLRSSASSNAASIQRYGLTRRQAVDTQTTNSMVAASTLSTALAASASIQPRATFTLRAVFAASGARYPMSYVQAGDYLTIRNLPPAASVAADSLRTFRITRVEFDPFTSVIQVEPEAPNPTLAALVGGQR